MLMIDTGMRAEPLTLLALVGLTIEVARAIDQPLFTLIEVFADADGARVEQKTDDETDEAVPTVN